MNKFIGYFFQKFIHSPKKEWIRFDNIFMVLGIIISVATLTVALALFEGYENSLKEVILSVNSHIYIFSEKNDYLNKIDQQKVTNFLAAEDCVLAFDKVIVTQAMATSKNAVKGALIKGIDWSNSEAYQDFVIAGNAALSEDDSAVLGYRLAEKLDLKIGDEFDLVSPLGTETNILGLTQKRKKFQIVGLYRSGMYEYDSKYVFLNRNSAANFNNVDDAITMFEVNLRDPDIDRANYLAYKWQYELGFDYQISSWIDFNGNLFSLLEMEKWVIFIILSFLVLIASFNVISAVSTSIIEKRKELGILKTFGASNYLLQKIFLAKALFIALISIFLGLVFGFLLAEFLSWQNFFLLKGDVYFLDTIHVDYSLKNLIITIVVTLLIVFFSILIPLKRIGKIQIIKIIRER